MEKIIERSADFEERVKNGGPFKTSEFELMTQEEFDKVIPATGPAIPEEAEKIRNGIGPAADKHEPTGPAKG